MILRSVTLKVETLWKDGTGKCKRWKLWYCKEVEEPETWLSWNKFSSFLWLRKYKRFVFLNISIYCNCSSSFADKVSQKTYFSCFDNNESSKEVLGINVLSLYLSKIVWLKSNSDLDLKRVCLNLISNDMSSMLFKPFLCKEKALSNGIVPDLSFSFLFPRIFSRSKPTSVVFGSRFCLVWIFLDAIILQLNHLLD